MSIRMRVAIGLWTGLSIVSIESAFAKEKWACKKGDSTVKVQGETAKLKEKDCLAKGGTWSKVEAPKQEAGSGGSW